MTLIEQANTASAGTQPIQFSLLRLRAWPDLPQLPAEEVVDLARVCALLSWRATAGVIVARILDMPKERVQEILLLLHAQGCLSVLAQPGATNAAQPEAAPADDHAAQPGDSFITKIWQRLAARN